jgi:uncharacterized protein DUF1553/uncharacterized protein DUF1549
MKRSGATCIFHPMKRAPGIVPGPSCGISHVRGLPQLTDLWRAWRGRAIIHSWFQPSGVLVLFLAASLLAGQSAAFAAASPARGVKRPPGKQNAKRAPAAQEMIRGLSISPRAISLDGAGAEQTLLVTGLAAGGAARDLTRTAVYRSTNPKIARVEADGTVRIVGDGAAEVEVRAGGKVARIPVKGRNARVSRPLNFANDVLPVLAKSGCNQASCHAKQGGKNGFQLSVFAFDPEADYYAVVRQADGRRVDRQDPARSLLLLKATLAVPHGGGQRFKPGSPEYTLIARWIAEGARDAAPDDPGLTSVEVEPKERVLKPQAAQQLQVTAVYSNGARRDVTRLAQFKTNESGVADVQEAAVLRTTEFSGEAAITVRYMGKVAVARVSVPLNKGVPASAYQELPRYNFIDDLVYRKLAQLNLLPSSLCDDSTFLRRAYLDLIGTLPTADETRAFLAECAAETAQGNGGMRKWGNDRKDISSFPHSPISSSPALKARARLVDQLLERPEYGDYWGMRWSNLLLVNPDLLLPRGAFAFDRWLRDSFRANMPFDQFARDIVTGSGETYRFGPPNFYRALPTPPEAGKAVSQLFLGVRLDCAQCHHHPFERWGQDDFYAMAAFFAQVKKKSTYPEGYHSVVYAGTDGEVKHPKTDQVMAPRPPGSGPMELADGEDRREALARWMTAPDNPFFARAIVNRMWGLLMARGIVEPVDDFRMTNPASNEPLLDALAKEFVAHGYDLKHLLRTITASAAYQRSSEATPNNARDTRNYSRYYTRRLPAEVLLDAVGQVTRVPQTFRAHPEGTRAIQMWDSRLDVEFLEIFGRPGRLSVCECDRPVDGSVPQMLHLMNSGSFQDRLSSDKGFAAALEKSGKSDDEVVTELYLTVYNRPPRPEELQAARSAFSREKTTRRAAIEDILWALMNSAEFVLNH